MRAQRDRTLTLLDGSEVRTAEAPCGTCGGASLAYWGERCEGCGGSGVAHIDHPRPTFVVCRLCGYEKPLGQRCGEPCV